MLNDLEKYLSFKKKSDFADLLGISPSTLSTWKARKTFDAELIFAKCKFVNPEWLLTGEGKMLKAAKIQGDPDFNFGPSKFSYKPIPLVNVSAVAGFGSANFSISEDEIRAYYVVPDFGTIDFMITIFGDSMIPKFTGGDIIACRQIQERSFIQWNKCHVLSTINQGILVKRILKSDRENCLLAVSENTAYQPFDIPMEEVNGIALVIGIIRLE